MRLQLAFLAAGMALAQVCAADDQVGVDGSLRLGGTVEITQTVEGPLKAAAGTLVLDAPVHGDVKVGGGNIHFTPAAQVTGGVAQEARRHLNWHTHSTGERFLRGWLWTAGLVVLAALLAGALPGPSARMAVELRERPWLTPLLGLVALSTIPVAAVLLMVTVIGIPIALLGLIGYAALLLLGYVWLAVAVGGLLLDRIKPEVAAQSAYRAGAAVLAMLALALLARTPFIGGLVVFTALVVGVGMIVGAIFRRRQPPAPATVVA